MSINTSKFQFQLELPPASLAEIAGLEDDGYFIHKEWANGIEMRTKNSVGGFGLFMRWLVIIFLPIVGVPYFGRTALDVIFGYKYKLFVIRNPKGPEVIFIG